MKKILLIIGLFILLPMNSKALMCENEDKIAYQEQAKNISVNYDYVENNDDVIFNIKFNNIPEQFIIYDATNVHNYFYQGNGESFGIRANMNGDIETYTPIGSEFTIENVEKNKNYTFQIMVNDIACRYKVMYTHYISIPSYNKYYKDKLCEGIEDYKLCNKWVDFDMSYDEWKTKVSNYIEKMNKKNNNENDENIKGIFDYVIEFYLKYYYFILPGVIVLAIGGIALYNKKHDLF